MKSPFRALAIVYLKAKNTQYLDFDDRLVSFINTEEIRKEGRGKRGGSASTARNYLGIYGGEERYR